MAKTNDDEVTRVARGATLPSTGSTASGIEVLRELDSYRTAISEAFEEGFAFGRLDPSYAVAWARSDARQVEAQFAFTRIAVGAIVRRESPPSTNAIDPSAQPSGTPTPRDISSSSSSSSSSFTDQ